MASGLGTVGEAGKPKPRPEVFTKTVRFLAETSSQVIITNHAAERMNERGITTHMLFDVLKLGIIKGEITLGDAPGDWKAKLACPMRGGRQVGVVTVITSGNKLIIVTTEWEDTK